MGKPRTDTTKDLRTAELVACVDGPLHGQWFHLAEWRERVACAKRMFKLNQPPTSALIYGNPVRADLVDHPYFDGVVGMAVRCGRDG